MLNLSRWRHGFKSRWDLLATDLGSCPRALIGGLQFECEDRSTTIRASAGRWPRSANRQVKSVIGVSDPHRVRQIHDLGAAVAE
jgi:hypothetical protein